MSRFVTTMKAPSGAYALEFSIRCTTIWLGIHSHQNTHVIHNLILYLVVELIDGIMSCKVEEIQHGSPHLLTCEAYLVDYRCIGF